MRVFFITIFIFLLNNSFYCQINNEEDLPTAVLLIKNEVRKNEIKEYSVNILTDISKPLHLNSTKDSKVVTWSLIQQTFGSSQTKELTLFNYLDSNIRNSTIRSEFLCLPNDLNCSSLKIPNFGLKYLGTYSYHLQIDNPLKNVYVDFNISAYMEHLDFKCDSNDECIHNESNQILTVLSGKSIPLECSIIVVQNGNFTPAAELIISSDLNKFDYCEIDTKIEQIPQSEINLNTNSNIKVYLYKISKKCSQVFNKGDNGKNLKCELKSNNPMVPSEFQILSVIESATNKIDVHYDPEILISSEQKLNKTIFHDQAETFNYSCPIESNPLPIYQWRIKKAQYNKTNEKGIFLTPSEFTTSKREFLIRKDLEIGYYEFECRARTEGLVGKYSNTVTFALNIIGIRN